MEAFVGKWQLCGSENFEEYMKSLGVGLMLRKLANQSKPVQEVSVEGDVTTIKSSTTFKTSEIKFKVGEEFEESTPDDKKVKSVIVKESDTKFVQTQKRETDNIITRELVGDEYVMTMEFSDVKCVRKYKKI